jgi:hypothetical protein
MRAQTSKDRPRSLIEPKTPDLLRSIPSAPTRSGLPKRKVVTVAMAADTDVLQRSTIAFGGDGVGLRAGTFHTDYDAAWTTTLTGCAFATDLTVTGTITWGANNLFVADLTVNGSGTAGGTLHVEGSWVPRPVGKFKVPGMLGGKQVAVLVPEA